jgi:hypothetical protein
MAHRNITVASAILRHAVGVILLCLTRAARAAGIAGLIGFVVAEVVATSLTHRFPAPGASHLVALALATVLAYGAGLTIVASELIRGLRDAVRLLLGEAEAGERAAAALVAREAGGVAALLQRAGVALAVSRAQPQTAWRRAPTPTPGRVAAWADPPAGAPQASSATERRPHRTFADEDPTPESQRIHRAAPARGDSLVDPRERRPGDAPTDETLAALASTSAPPATPPPTALDRSDPAATSPLPALGHPVPAGQLPRIEWADDPPATPPDPASSPTLAAPPAPASPITRPLPLESTDPSAAAAPHAAPDPLAEPGLAEPQTWHVDDSPLPTPTTWHDPLRGAAADDEEDAGIRPVDAFGGSSSSAITRPLPQNTRPLPETMRGRDTRPSAPRGSVWDHISQVLAGRPLEPLPLEDEDDASADQPGSPPPESAPPAG